MTDISKRLDNIINRLDGINTRVDDIYMYIRDMRENIDNDIDNLKKDFNIQMLNHLKHHEKFRNNTLKVVKWGLSTSGLAGIVLAVLKVVRVL